MSAARTITRAIHLLYRPPLTRLFTPQIFRYCACGAINMVLDAVWYFVIYNFIVGKRFLDLGFAVVSPHILALAIVFPITFFTGFWLNRNVAFVSTRAAGRRQLGRYALSVAGSVLLNYVSMKLLVEAVGIWPTPSKLLTTLICAVYSYLAGRCWVFRR